MGKVKYRTYDPSINIPEIEFLADVDEYYPDILETLSSINEPRIFITSWLIQSLPSGRSPSTKNRSIESTVKLSSSMKFGDLLVSQLKKPGSKIYILWNTNYSGRSYKNLKQIAENLHKSVIKLAHVSSDRFKIILSSNLEFEPPDLPWQSDALYLGVNLLTFLNGLDQPPSLIDWLRKFLWEEFPVDSEEYLNLSIFTLGSHHQKTFSIIGKKSGESQSSTISYCGGIDFSNGPAGKSSYGVFFGGKWWHDAAMRVKGGLSIPILENFVERWNSDLESVNEGKTLSFGVNSSDELNLDDLISAIPDSSANSDIVEIPRTIFGDTETFEVYEDWIPEATQEIIIINQYFRHFEISSLLEEQLEDESNLNLTIVIPSYTEEIGKRKDPAEVREEYAKARTDEARQKAYEKAVKKSLTIDPLNKLTLYMRSKSLKKLINNPRTQVWIPNPMSKFPGCPYIHAKILIVDNKIMMVGSANVNGRSLSGKADTEINVLLKNPQEIERIKSKHKWNIRPENENSNDYPNSWYAQHSLIRYTESHRIIDEIYGHFPSGRQEIINYFNTFKTDGRSEAIRGKFDVNQFLLLLDNVPTGIDINDSLGEQLASIVGHLI